MEFCVVSPGALGVDWSRPLYLAGRLPAVPRVAVVGSRAARRRYLACIPAIVQTLAERGMALVSGGAVGIDGAAHRAALSQGVPQVAVLPGPPDALYPADHRGLFEDIVHAGGAVICPHPPGTGLRKGMFASRNHIVVQLSVRVVAMEAGARSGTQGTLALALRTGVAVSGVVGTPGVAWAIERGGSSLGPSDPADVRARLSQHLEGICALPTWPPTLRSLQDILERQGAATVDDFDDPLAGAVALAEAEAAKAAAEVAAANSAPDLTDVSPQELTPSDAPPSDAADTAVEPEKKDA